MKVAAPFLSLLLLATSSVAVTVSFDPNYDVKGSSLASVACSDGPNGLLTKHFTTFGSLPKFPYIGGTQAVTGWNSDKCGTCWALTYGSKTINVLAVDHADSGFNVAKQAMDKLTNGQAAALGRVNATVKQVATSACGL